MIWLIIYLIGVFATMAFCASIELDESNFRMVLTSVVWPLLLVYLAMTLIKDHYERKKNMGEVSDGYHTFNSLYRQRLILTAALVKAHKDVAWKSWRHEDGELCFGGGWFIVGFDTPQGCYTYHYEAKDWGLFDCVELPAGKHWDGHTDEDVERLLSIPSADVAPGGAV